MGNAICPYCGYENGPDVYESQRGGMDVECFKCGEHIAHIDL